MRFFRRLIVSNGKRIALAVFSVAIVIGAIIFEDIFLKGKDFLPYFDRHADEIALVWVVWGVGVYVFLAVLNAVIKNWDNELVRKTTFGAMVWLIGAFIFLFTNGDGFRYWNMDDWVTLFVPPIFIPSALYIYHSYIK